MDATPLTAQNARHQSEFLLSFGLLGVLVVLIIPLPTILLDTFLAANLSISILILLITLNIKRPLEISVFPSMLLLLTLARLSLNVATTRLILLNGDAGKIVSTFGGFVVGGNIVVGLVIFLILVVIQFIVITKGSARVSEVAARFTLDALPGKQMAIDAELGAGTINEEQARQKRESLNLETEFYGSMDGAGKFVRGDAIAGVVITAINLVGGVIIGISNGYPLSTAIRTYSTLTIGDGLVSQIPGLIIATTSGILVTKATSKFSLGSEIGSQVTQHSKPLLISGIILGALAFTPGLPKIPFISLALLMIFLWQQQRNDAKKPAEKLPEPKASPESRLEKHFHEFLQVDQACVEIGVRLVTLVDSDHERGLVGRISELRSELARKHGIWVPAVRVRDSIRLQPDVYRIIVNGREVAQGQLDVDSLMAIDPGGSTGTLEGKETRDPAFGLPAKWIPQSLKTRASRQGFTIVDPTTVLITHLGEVLRKFAPDLLSREDLAKLLDELKKTSPTLVDDIKPDVIRKSDVHQVLRTLLEERVPITNLARILESLLQHAPHMKDPALLADRVRASLGREILDRFRNENGTVNAIVLEPMLEKRLRESVTDGVLALSPSALEKLLTRINETWQTSIAQEHEAILLVESPFRRTLKNAIERAVPDVVVMAYSEVPKDIQIEFKSMLKIVEVFPIQESNTGRTSRQEHLAVA